MDEEEVEEIITNFKKFCEKSGGQLSEEISSQGIYQATCRYDEQKDLKVFVEDFFKEEGTEVRDVDIQLYPDEEPFFCFSDRIYGHNGNFVSIVFEKTPIISLETDNINKAITLDGVVKVKEIVLKINVENPNWADPKVILRGQENFPRMLAKHIVKYNARR